MPIIDLIAAEFYDNQLAHIPFNFRYVPLLSFKIATWLDETLSAVAFKLEHPAQLFAEFRNQTVTGLHVCDLYSCVQLNNGSLFWW